MQTIQTLDTTGARAVETFVQGGTRYLVVAQFAADRAGQPAQMTLGDSDIASPVLRWEGGRFVPHAQLAVPGCEDAQHFRIGGRDFLACASLRRGADPYDLNADSPIYEVRDGAFVPLQQVPAFGAKQWRHWSVGERHFLGLAAGVGPDAPARQRQVSTLFEWNGQGFEPFQEVPSSWGYNWASARVRGEDLVAHADHLAPSLILRWDGRRFAPWQEMPGKTGRAFCFFQADGEDWLAFACLMGETVLYRHDGERYVAHQTICGPGGRELLWDAPTRRLLVVNFIRGSREAPQTVQQSCFFRFEGGRLVPGETFETCGGTDATLFTEAGVRYLLVSESLSPQVRFRTPSRLYRLEP